MTLYSMKVKGNMSIVHIDVERFKTSLLKKCEVQNRQALRVWLKTALLHIPGYTGTARGTFYPVGRLVRRTVTKFGPGGQSGNPDRAKRKKLIYYKGRTYTAGFEAGRDYASATLRTDISGVKITNSFIFTNNLPYVARNEENPPPEGWVMPSNPPWRALEKAASAWKKYILTVVPVRVNISREIIKIEKFRIF